MRRKPCINILLIEDNEDDIFFVKKALPEDEYSLSIIKSGAQALEYLKKPAIKPDIILLDKSLPELNGIELLEELEKHNLHYSIIFLTVDSNVDTVIQAMKYGAMDFVIKSTKLKTELPEKIEKVFNIHLEKLEKKRLEEDLKESEYRFRTMFSNSPIAYQSLDENGVFVDVNKGLCDMLGYKPNELLGKSFGDFWFNKSDKSFIKAFKSFKKQGQIVAEIDLRHKNEYKVSVVLEGRVQYDTKKEFVKTHCVLHNITERKLMELTLAHQYDFQKLVAGVASRFINLRNIELENVFFNILEMIGKFYRVARCYIYRFRIEGNSDVNIASEWCSEGIESHIDRLDILPWEKYTWFVEQIRGKEPIIINSIEELPNSAEAEKKEFRNRKIKSFVCIPIIKKDIPIGFLGLDAVSSNIKWFNRHKTELGVIEKTISGAIIQIDAENAQKESEIRYKTVADYTFNWEYWVLPDNSITYMSPIVKQITGYSADEFKKNPELLSKIIITEDKQKWDEHKNFVDSNYTEMDCSSETEFRIKAKSGEIKWIKHLCRRINSEDGGFLGIRVSNQDITHQVEMEKRLLNITTEVEEKERNRFSKELHDGLGPLLSSVKLYFQWLSETDDSEKIKLISEKGNQNIDLAIQSTREISHNLNPQFLVKHGFVAALENFTSNINAVGKIKITFSYNSKNRFEIIKEKVIYSIACELINNTIKHSGATLAEISFNYDINIGLSLKYTDDGKGFNSEEILERQNTNGLGLSSIFQKIRTLRGQVKINSEPGKGMSAYIEL